MSGHNPRGSALRDSIIKVLREYAEALAIAVLLALLLRVFVLAAFKIPTYSMSPTLLKGDFIFAYKLAYGNHWNWMRDENFRGQIPDRGELVIFKCPKNPRISCIKRVVGLPGDRIEMLGYRVTLNRKAANYVRLPDNQSELPNTLQVKEQFERFEQEIVIDNESSSQRYGPFVVPPGHLFVLGDYRNSTDDSRYWGPVPIRSLQARALFVWLSLGWKAEESGDWHPFVRWSRLFDWVD